MDDTNKPAALDELEAITLPDLEVGGFVFRSSDYPTQEAAEAALSKLIQSILSEVRERQAARASVDGRVRISPRPWATLAPLTAMPRT